MRLQPLGRCFLPVFLCLISNARAGICSDFSRVLPNVTLAQCEAANLHDMQARSVQGRALLGRDVVPVAAPDLRILVLGGIHGDEMSSSALVFNWIPLGLNAQQDTGHTIQWRFIPVLNPDGLLAKPARRMNANGVDLNRNFPTPDWNRDARAYWEKRTRRDPRRWPGNKPLSEPESRFLLQQMESFKPNLIVSVHAPYGLLDFDGPEAPPRKLGRLFLDQVGIYPGSLGNYSGVHKHVPVVTIELPNAARTPSPVEISGMWSDLLAWVDAHLQP
jgi:protein MpaA